MAWKGKHWVDGALERLVVFPTDFRGRKDWNKSDS